MSGARPRRSCSKRHGKGDAYKRKQRRAGNTDFLPKETKGTKNGWVNGLTLGVVIFPSEQERLCCRPLEYFGAISRARREMLRENRIRNGRRRDRMAQDHRAGQFRPRSSNGAGW